MRRFTDGAEFGDMLFWTFNGNSSNNIASTDVKRSGSYSYRIWNAYVTKSITPASEVFIRFAVYNPAYDVGIFQFRDGSNNLCSIYLNSTGFIEARVNNSPVATGTRIYTWTSNFNLIEAYLLLSDTGVFQIKLNGLMEINYSGDTKPTSATTIDNFYVYLGGNLGYFDDFAYNDTDNSDGKNDNSWCGDGHIEILLPNANGDSNVWIGSDGNSTDNYLLVDEIPKDDDTTYVVSSGTVGEIDMYNLASFTDTNKTVRRIWAEIRAKDASAASGVIKLGFKTEGNIYLSSGTALPSVYYPVAGESYLINPIGSGTWTKTDLDSIQFVIESA